MNARIIRTLAAVLLASPLIGFGAGTARLNVRLGLWETKSTSTHSGGPAVPAMPGMHAGTSREMAEAMKNMPPERRAQVAAAMAQMSQPHQPHTITDRSCLTREKMERDGFLNSEEMQAHCTRTVLQNDGRVAAVSFSCTGEGAGGKGKVRFEATSPTSVKGTMDMTMTIQGTSMSTHTEMASTWIGPDCGKEE
jgi:hypothetical protein